MNPREKAIKQLALATGSSEFGAEIAIRELERPSPDFLESLKPTYLTPEQVEERKLRDKKRELTPKQRRSRKKYKLPKQARKINR